MFPVFLVLEGYGLQKGYCVIGISSGNLEHWELEESIAPRLGTDWEQDWEHWGVLDNQNETREVGTLFIRREDKCVDGG